MNPPIYQDGIYRTFDQLSLNDQVLQFSQSYVFETQFVNGNIQQVEGIKFEHHELIPGRVGESAEMISEAMVSLNATYNRDVAAELTDQEFVVRPTGYYLPAGSFVTISAPSGMENSGLSVIVGVQFRNMDYGYLTVVNRFPDISAEFLISNSELKVKLNIPGASGMYFLKLKWKNKSYFHKLIKQ